MPPRPVEIVPNYLLRTIPPDELRTLEPHLKPEHLERGAVLFEPGAPIERLVFVHRGIVSLLSYSGRGKGESIEVAVVGAEGVVADEAVLYASRLTHRAMVQLPGEGSAIGLALLQQMLPSLPCLHERILRHLHLLMTQLSQSVVCSRFHPTSQRLARWLLTCRDRSGTDTLSLTQELLSHMLGVPRTWVTRIAGEFQEQGLIGYRSGVITIHAAEALERCACECYRVTHAQLEEYGGLDAANRCKPANGRVSEANRCQ